MRELFGTILGMSLIGCYSAAVVFAVRLALLKLTGCPRKYVYYLWAIVFLNLCIPFPVRSPVSLIPEAVENLALRTEERVSDTVYLLSAAGESEVLADFGASAVGEPDFGAPAAESTKSGAVGRSDLTMKADGQGAAALRGSAGSVFWRAAPWVWLSGVVLAVGFQALQAVCLALRLRKSRCVRRDDRRRIREYEGLPAPFLWGILRPVVCLPADLEPEEREHITAHEECHRKRRDPLLRSFFLLTAICHWFNPAVWLAYGLSCRDMEISCDEAVLERTEGDIRKRYAESILKYAAKQNGYLLTPLTFGEPSVRSRIRSVLRYRKRSVFVSLLALLCVLGAAAGLLLRPQGSPADRQEQGAAPETGESRKSAEEERQEAPAPEGNGNSLIRVGGKLYYLEGRSLWSDGNRIYLSMEDEDGVSWLYQYETDGSGSRRIGQGRLVGGDAGGEQLYYERLTKDGSGRELAAYDTATMESEPLGAAYEGTASCLYADGVRILWSAGEYEDGAFHGELYFLDPETGTVGRGLFTDAERFFVMDGSLYYEKKSGDGTVEPGIYRADLGLSGETLAAAELSLLGTDPEHGRLLAARRPEDRAISILNREMQEKLSVSWDLVSVGTLPDDSREEGLVRCLRAFGIRQTERDGYLGGDLLGEWPYLQASWGDMRYEEPVVIGDTLYVRAELWGSWEEQETEEPKRLAQEWLAVKLDGSGCERWDPGLAEAPGL
ncbi:MAG: M56 family metallopeptidase [Eubacteriales bacterium]|nr:M56 family metallopeptidase [Eubacteriales bacterium]